MLWMAAGTRSRRRLPRAGHTHQESKRIASQLDKLLDAYQEDLIGLGDLRRRAPELRRKQAAIEKELEGVALQALEQSRLTQLNASMENFLAALRQSAKKL